MNLDELREKWADHDRKLETRIRLNRQLLTALKLNRVRPVLHRHVLVLWAEMLATFAAIVALGDFTYDHIAAARFAVPGAALDLFAIAILIATARQLAAAAQIDFDGPVAAIQQHLEQLRLLRIRTTQWTMLASPLAWTPLLIVALKGLFGLDAYRLFSAAWLWANLLFGVAVIPVALWLSKRYAGRDFPFVQRLVDDLAGHSLNEARRFLATLSEFEAEERGE